MTSAKQTWEDPYAKYWQKEMVGRSVVLTVNPVGAGPNAAPTGFVVGKVLGQQGDVLWVDLGPRKHRIDVHMGYVFKTLMDDEPEPDMIGDMKRL